MSKLVDAKTFSAVGLKVLKETFFPWPSNVSTGSFRWLVSPSSGICHSFSVVSSLALTKRFSAKGP